MKTFSHNTAVQLGTNAASVAVMKLSIDGYAVQRVTTESNGNVSILIDRPYEEIPFDRITIAKVAEKSFGQCGYRGCRIYWEIKGGLAE